MATGGFKPNAATDFLEEWKAKREKMRAKMLGDIAAATGAPLGANNPNTTTNTTNNNSHRHAAPTATERTHTSSGSSPDRSTPAGNCLPPSYTVARSSSGTALKRPEEEMHHPASPTSTPPGSNPKKATPQPDQAPCDSPDSSPMACNDSDKGSPSPSKVKEKNSSGPSARKGKGQIEKRKLREKRRSTGVVSIPSNESLDELDDDDAVGKDRKEEEELVQANTYQNEAMTADPAIGHLMETPRSGSGRHKSSTGSEEEVGGNSRQRHNRHCRDEGAAVMGSLEKRMEELEKELARERQENDRLLKAHEDKDDLIGKLREEIDLLNRDLDDIEDENEQLKQENKTLLKVVGQLTR
ncbi:PRKC apoptosis WT1 regulator protein [Anoplopoma fimbria]|uniref:PRKC apoptosis WT1 regulator protein n=1 Tax=Anoplopoma fimbria TaxID=229290 RepID=UPI0023ECABF8|nr:PRKC apoptosis WT1 regulator protein [Anoplopoma fimbria]